MAQSPNTRRERNRIQQRESRAKKKALKEKEAEKKAKKKAYNKKYYLEVTKPKKAKMAAKKPLPFISPPVPKASPKATTSQQLSVAFASPHAATDSTAASLVVAPRTPKDATMISEMQHLDAQEASVQKQSKQSDRTKELLGQVLSGLLTAQKREVELGEKEDEIHSARRRLQFVDESSSSTSPRRKRWVIRTGSPNDNAMDICEQKEPPQVSYWNVDSTYGREEEEDWQYQAVDGGGGYGKWRSS